MSSCPTRFTIARWKADDLPAIEQVEVDEHVETCADCRAVADEIAENSAEYNQTFSAREDRLMRAIRREKAKGTAGRDVDMGVLFRTRVAPVIGIAAAIATIVILVADPFDRGGGDPGEISFKGDWTYEVVAKRKDDRFEVTDSAVLEKGDAIRFSVTSSSPSYVCVFSLSQTGEATLFYPEGTVDSEPSPLAVDPGRNELPGSVVLDDSKGTEHFVIVHSNEKFDVGRIVKEVSEASARGESFPEVDGIDIESVGIEKR